MRQTLSSLFYRLWALFDVCTNTPLTRLSLADWQADGETGGRITLIVLAGWGLASVHLVSFRSSALGAGVFNKGLWLAESLDDPNRLEADSSVVVAIIEIQCYASKYEGS